MEGVDREWNLLSPNTNRISYNNLDYQPTLVLHTLG